MTDQMIQGLRNYAATLEGDGDTDGGTFLRLVATTLKLARETRDEREKEIPRLLDLLRRICVADTRGEPFVPSPAGCAECNLYWYEGDVDHCAVKDPPP